MAQADQTSSHGAQTRRVDVLVVGAGFAGMYAVYRFREMGKQVAGIEAGNAASLALHERFGFVRVGMMPEVGRKFDRWLDLVLMQRVLAGRR